MMTKQRGRPAGATGKAKQGFIHVRVDELEQEGFAEAAALAGLTVSAWARERLRQVCRKELQKNGKVVPFLPSQNPGGAG
jgi:hypothetical protein